jgi:hypothetical protein
MFSKTEKAKKISFSMNWRLKRCFMFEVETEIVVQSIHHHHHRHRILIQIMEGDRSSS